MKHKSERLSENTTVQSGNQQEDDELQADIAAAIASSLKDLNSAQVRENATNQGIENLNLQMAAFGSSQVPEAEPGILNYCITVEHLLTIKAEESIEVEQRQLPQSQKPSPPIEISPLQTRAGRARKASAKAAEAAEAEQMEHMSKSMSKSPKKNPKK